MKGYPDDWATRRKKVKKRDAWECQSCGRKGGPRGTAQLHVHHIVPKSKGGSHALSNLKLLCDQCHADIHNDPRLLAGPDGKYSNYYEATEDIKELKRQKKHDEAEELLLWCIKTSEKERKRNQQPSPWYYKHLGIVYRKEDRYEDEVNILQQYLTRCQRASETPRQDLVERLQRARELAQNSEDHIDPYDGPDPVELRNRTEGTPSPDHEIVAKIVEFLKRLK
jgi:hypothetical protein